MRRRSRERLRRRKRVTLLAETLRGECQPSQKSTVSFSVYVATMRALVMVIDSKGLNVLFVSSVVVWCVITSGQCSGRDSAKMNKPFPSPLPLLLKMRILTCKSLHSHCPHYIWYYTLYFSPASGECGENTIEECHTPDKSSHDPFTTEKEGSETNPSKE